MAKLLYINNMSVDGYVADTGGRFDWTAPSEEVIAFHGELQRTIGTHLYGRRLYNLMAIWETLDAPEEFPDQVEFAQHWRAADKVVYSTTLESPSTPRTRIERSFNPEDVRRLKAAAERDIMVGGAGLAGQAIAAGLVDEIHLLVLPVLVGGGLRALPDNVRLDLTLLEQRSFGNGTVYNRYGMR